MIDEGGQSQHMLPLKGQAGQTAEKAKLYKLFINKQRQISLTKK